MRRELHRRGDRWRQARAWRLLACDWQTKALQLSEELGRRRLKSAAIGFGVGVVVAAMLFGKG